MLAADADGLAAPVATTQELTHEATAQPPQPPPATMSPALKIVALALPALAVVLVGVWMGSVLTSYAKTGDVVKANSLAGFSWASGDGRVFNWHPLLMTFGFVFCSTTAALSYISLPFTRKTNKLIHMTSHGVGAITALVGAIAVFRFHNEHNITNLYSLHSWLGLFTWVCFVTQWIFGLVTYYYPGARPQVRAATISYHIGGGIGILALIYITAATGVLEKLSFNGSCNVTGNLDGRNVVGFMANDCVLGNIIGLVLALSLIVTITAIVHTKLSQLQQIPAARGETSPLVGSRADKKNGHGKQKADHNV